ncbi:MAG: AraC family transcriptional regulator [Timaviella obliquedivisa GSE-PSE-MK23-08B]|jgi:AraC-like DNA-binding protein|nr:AraC family transcriptional regulator [Timaviella obliquedivisa GSE-PSE-MK23-08B]
MAIALSQADYWALFQESVEGKQPASDEVDIIRKYPSQLGHGFWREVDLREGLYLTIADYTLHDDVISEAPDREHPLEYMFYLCNSSTSGDRVFRAGQYNFCGSGVAPREISRSFAQERHLTVNVHIEPELFGNFLGNPADQLPPELKHLIQQSTQEYYFRSGLTTVPMQVVLQQLLNCPYQGITKRLYLECKVWELLTLLIEQELDIRSGKSQVSSFLKRDDVDRIHHAKEILLNRLDNPPSLLELAHQVGLNDCKLKQGFRQVFGKTVFGYLHDYRLEQAQQLLTTGQINIREAAKAVGYTSQSAFAVAFKRKFGVNPKLFQKSTVLSVSMSNQSSTA